MLDLLVKYWEQGLIFPSQLVLLIIDGYILMKKPNNFIIISLLFLLSLFALQAIRRRFLLYFPKNIRVNRNSAYWDTYYLRIVIIFSTFFTGLGIIADRISFPICMNWTLCPSVAFGFLVVLFIIIPTVFWIINNWLNEGIAKKLKSFGPTTESIPCPFSGCDSVAFRVTEVLDSYYGYITLKCPSCNNSESFIISLNVGD